MDIVHIQCYKQYNKIDEDTYGPGDMKQKTYTYPIRHQLNLQSTAFLFDTLLVNFFNHNTIQSGFFRPGKSNNASDHDQLASHICDVI